MNHPSFYKYERLMRSLSVKITKGIKAPHKAIMLITIIDNISQGKIQSNKIDLSDELAKSFRAKWKCNIEGNKTFSMYSCAPWTPFWHLKKETFWHFRPKSNSSNIEKLVGPGETASIGKMRNNIDYAYLDNELYELLLVCKYRGMIRAILFDEYIKPYVNEDVTPLVSENCNISYKKSKY